MSREFKQIVMEGNAFDGLTFYGPFKDVEDATEFADIEDLEDWRVCPMIMPDVESGFESEGPKFHYCAGHGGKCQVRLYDPKEEYCQHHEANKAFGVE